MALPKSTKSNKILDFLSILSASFSVLLVVLFVLLIIAAFVAMPLALVWSLNCLFPVLHIPYSFSTWLASLVLIIFFSPDKNKIDYKKDRK